MAPGATLEGLDLYPVRLPMRYRFRRVDHREAILIRGPAGWGEFSPFREYPPQVTSRWLASALEAACVGWPEPVRDRIPVNLTVPAVDPDTAGELVARSGCETVKVKVGEVGQTESDDMARLEAVRAALGGEGAIRVDVNGAWDVETAARRITQMSRFRLEYVEQPVASIEEMRELRARVDVPLAADELIRAMPDPLEVVEEQAADVVVLKVQPLGGVERTLDLAARAGVPTVISSALETSVGMAAGVAAAAALPELELACGLGTVSLLADDVVERPLISEGGWLEVRRPEPTEELLDKHRPDAETAAGMLRRVWEAAEVLA